MIVVLAGLSGCGRERPPESGATAVTDKKLDLKSGVSETASGKSGADKGEWSDAELTQANALYVRNCAGCHGDNGDGQGLAASFLYPKPRNFRKGPFRLVTTTNGVPTISDLELVLSRGMPGSAMPPWPTLSNDQRTLLARRVIEFRREGIRDQEISIAREAGEDVDMREVAETVADLTTPGPAIEVPDIPEPTAELVKRGRELYLSIGCNKCHGDGGKGDGQQAMVDSEGIPVRARDLTRGIFKGNPDPRSIYIRTQSGMPGTPMPASPQLDHEQISELVHFVLSLSDEETRKSVVLNRERIVAVRSDAKPLAPSDPVWANVAVSSLRLTPLWWRNDFANHLDVQALHDGQNLAVRLSWDDATSDRHAARTESFEDAVAAELYRGDVEPFMGMGGPNTPVDVWYWDADRQGRPAEVEDLYPNMVVDLYPFSEVFAASAQLNRVGARTADQPDISLPARASGNPIVPTDDESGGSSLTAGGPGSVTFHMGRNPDVRAFGEWKDGRWSVVLSRPLIVDSSNGGISLKPGESAAVAFAVWDGSQRDRNGKKLITIWQDLELEP